MVPGGGDREHRRRRDGDRQHVRAPTAPAPEAGAVGVEPNGGGTGTPGGDGGDGGNGGAILSVSGSSVGLLNVDDRRWQRGRRRPGRRRRSGHQRGANGTPGADGTGGGVYGAGNPHSGAAAVSLRNSLLASDADEQLRRNLACRRRVQPQLRRYQLPVDIPGGNPDLGPLQDNGGLTGHDRPRRRKRRDPADPGGRRRLPGDRSARRPPSDDGPLRHRRLSGDRADRGRRPLPVGRPRRRRRHGERRPRTRDTRRRCSSTARRRATAARPAPRSCPGSAPSRSRSSLARSATTRSTTIGLVIASLRRHGAYERRHLHRQLADDHAPRGQPEQPHPRRRRHRGLHRQRPGDDDADDHPLPRPQEHKRRHALHRAAGARHRNPPRPSRRQRRDGQPAHPQDGSRPRSLRAERFCTRRDHDRSDREHALLDSVEVDSVT